jgi:hypothetical protein
MSILKPGGGGGGIEGGTICINKLITNIKLYFSTKIRTIPKCF